MITLTMTVLVLAGVSSCAAPDQSGAARPSATPGQSTEASGAGVPAGPSRSSPVSATSTPGLPARSPQGTTVAVSRRPEITKAPVQLGDYSSAAGVVARLDSLKRISAPARLPGEVAGPAVAATLSITNVSRTALDLSSVVVTLTDARGQPGREMSAEPAKPFRGSLGFGSSTRGTYVFAVSEAARGRVRVNLTPAGGTPALVFTADA